MRQRVSVGRRAVTNVGGIGRETWPVLYARQAAEVSSRQERQEVVIDGIVQTQAVRSYSVRTRYLDDVTTADRLVYHHRDGDRVLQILGLTDAEERGRWLLAECVEVRA